MRMAFATLLIADYDEAIAFFVDGIGFELVEDSPSVADDGTSKRWVVVRPPGAETGFVLAEARGDAQRHAMGNQLGGRVGFFLQVDDFDAQYSRMIAAGVHFTEPPRSEPYGNVAVWRDISGNHWDLLGPPPKISDP